MNITTIGNEILTENISGLYYKSFTIIIYDHNDSTILEPVL